ncbi:transposase [Streptomyces sp. NPDC048231]|uniref:transposase n=1 Tax=Streptomyces sp. NPDC048231 TaxID=3365519 RepID=UPI003719DF47
MTDAEREFVLPLLPVSLRGRRWLDDPTVLNGIVWKLRTGTAWRSVPERCGPWATLHTHFNSASSTTRHSPVLRASATGGPARKSCAASRRSAHGPAPRGVTFQEDSGVGRPVATAPASVRRTTWEGWTFRAIQGDADAEGRINRTAPLG